MAFQILKRTLSSTRSPKPLFVPRFSSSSPPSDQAPSQTSLLISDVVSILTHQRSKSRWSYLHSLYPNGFNPDDFSKIALHIKNNTRLVLAFFHWTQRKSLCNHNLLSHSTIIHILARDRLRSQAYDLIRATIRVSDEAESVRHFELPPPLETLTLSLSLSTFSLLGFRLFPLSNNMQDPLSMSLDDLIKTSKKSGSGNARGRGGRGTSGPGPARRLPNRGANRTTPYPAAAKAPEAAWQHDMYGDIGAAAYAAPAGRASGIETGTKLYISNLDYGVSNEDIKELFSEVGDLKRYGVHYDRSGRSKGTADVVFSRRTDAAAAVKRYNNVQLDGKPMKIEIVGTNIGTPGAPPAFPPAANGNFGNRNGPPMGGQSRGGAFGRIRGGGGGGGGGRGGRGPRRGGGGRGSGRGRGEKDQKVSAEDLDAELEKYHAAAESMQE